MAVDVASPRLSFSYDLNQTDHVFPLRSDSFPTIDFDFNIAAAAAAYQISSADELFSNGKILPVTQIKKIQETHQPKSNISLNEPKKKRLKEFLTNQQDNSEEDEEEKTPLSKSFWKFTRSTSLNFDNTKGKMLRKLQKLSRSNSTGSAPISKQIPSPKTLEKQSSQKQQQQQQKQPVFRRSSSSPVTSSNSYFNPNYNSSKRPALKKSCSGYRNGNAIRFTPVLNIPPGYGSMSLFGLGSLFCNGKYKKKKK